MTEMYCIHCGHPIPADSQFCPNCGKPTPNNESEFVSPTNKNSDEESDPNDPKKQSIQEIIEHFTEKRLSHRAKLLFAASYFANTAVVPALLIAGMLLYPIAFLVFLAVYLLTLYAMAELAHRNFRYCLTETSFEKRQGIVHIQSVTVPYVQIQDVNIIRTFVDRMLGLSRVNIETAGSSSGEPREVIGGGMTHAEAHLPGVTAEEAQQLHDALFELAHKRHIA